MRTKKIRGLRRRQKNIDAWFASNKLINLGLLKKTGYYYCKSKIDPWSNLYCGATYPSNYRKQLFSRLLDIYDKWDAQLKENFQEYFLEIWVYGNDFINSQVVSAVGGRIAYYKNMWDGFETNRPFPNSLFNHELQRIDLFNWISADDVNFVAESDFLDAKVEECDTLKDYNSAQRFYQKLVDSNTPIRMVGNEENEQRMFAVKQGTIWIGSK